MVRLLSAAEHPIPPPGAPKSSRRYNYVSKRKEIVGIKGITGLVCEDERQHIVHR
jgi:hypothetical protein